MCTGERHSVAYPSGLCVSGPNYRADAYRSIVLSHTGVVGCRLIAVLIQPFRQRKDVRQARLQCSRELEEHHETWFFLSPLQHADVAPVDVTLEGKLLLR